MQLQKNVTVRYAKDPDTGKRLPFPCTMHNLRWLTEALGLGRRMGESDFRLECVATAVSHVFAL